MSLDLPTYPWSQDASQGIFGFFSLLASAQLEEPFVLPRCLLSFLPSGDCPVHQQRKGLLGWQPAPLKSRPPFVRSTPWTLPSLLTLLWTGVVCVSEHGTSQFALPVLPTAFGHCRDRKGSQIQLWALLVTPTNIRGVRGGCCKL